MSDEQQEEKQPSTDPESQACDDDSPEEKED